MPALAVDVPQYNDWYCLQPDELTARGDVIIDLTHCNMAIGPEGACSIFWHDGRMFVEGLANMLVSSAIDSAGGVNDYSMRIFRKKPIHYAPAPNFTGWVQTNPRCMSRHTDVAVCYDQSHSGSYSHPSIGNRLYGSIIPIDIYPQLVPGGGWAIYREEALYRTEPPPGQAAPSAPFRHPLNPYFSRPLPLP